MPNIQNQILIVEDERPLAKALELKLSQAGFGVKSVYNGREAIDELGKAPADLVLLDLLMPETDGWEVLKWLHGRGIKVVVISNLNQEEDVQRAKELGAEDFWVKSNLSLSDIVEKITAILRR
ncbi:MAG TPA: response regulator [Patescibacteria group bacterium]|nr:response regulator [Patescibacteria group bacterium]